MISDFTVTDATTIIASLAAGIVLIVGSVVTGVISIRNSQRASDKIRESNQESNDQKLDQIHLVTNSNLTRVTEELAAAKKELADLRLLVQSLASKGTITATEAAKAESIPTP